MRPPLLLLLLLSPGVLAQVPGSVTGQQVPCTGGTAAGFACSGVDLLAFLSVPDLGGAEGVRLNDIWGWTDPETGKEYALVGRSDGTAFVDLSDPVQPVYLGVLPTHTGSSLWRDLKVYADHVFVVSEAAGHGMQVFDLRQLRNVAAPPVTFTETAHYGRFSTAHNLAVNEETGFAYIVGIQRPQDIPAEYPNQGLGQCGPGLHAVDIRDPARPQFAGCFTDLLTGGRTADGYTHDVQCVLYRGPDEEHQGREICIGSNEKWISIADVTDKAGPVVISRATYPTAAYVHQGWLTEDHRYFLQDDELDEIEEALDLDRTRTIIWDLTDLDEPVVLKEYRGVSTSTDHNQYIVGNYAFQANYTSGLRILDISEIENPGEVAFFDTYPANDDPGFQGAWSNYPFFESGIVVVSSIGEGLFVLAPTALRVATEAAGLPQTFGLSPAYPNPFNPRTSFALQVDAAQHVAIEVYNAQGRPVARVYDGVLSPGTHRFAFAASHLASGVYFVRATGAHASEVVPVTLVK